MSFKTSQLSLLEKTARLAACLSGERALFFKHPTIVLATCNRIEFYFSADDLAEAQTDLLSFFRLHLKEAFEHRLYSYFGQDALFHLCRVTSGLDSAMWGETEIQGQVKTAYLRAAEILKLPSALHYAFQKSLHLAKELRNRFFNKKWKMSLQETIGHLAKERLGNLETVSILLVGYSAINRGLGSFLAYRKIPFSLCTKHPTTIYLQGAIVCGRDVLQRWYEYDLIVCASKVDGYLIEGRGKGNVIFDLGLPRNVNPQVAEVTLMNIEQIQQWISHKECQKEISIDEVKQFLEERVALLIRGYELSRSQNSFAHET